jgi:excinuclease ABC subunit C
VLDEIPGVGPARRKSLMKAYESIEALRNAAPPEISEKAGIPLNIAESISEYLNRNVTG